jgi:hypothetical protein
MRIKSETIILLLLEIGKYAINHLCFKSEYCQVSELAVKLIES